MARVLALLLCLVPVAARAEDDGGGEGAPVTAKPFGAADLARLRDIGPVAPQPGEQILSLSPDLMRAAFQVRQADPVTNSYRLSLVVAATDGGAAPIVVDTGGDFMHQMVDGVGGAYVSTGYAAATPIRWSPDGSHIFFLKRLAGSTQVWRAAADGSGSEQVTHDEGDVEAFALSGGGHGLIYAAQRRDPAVEADRHREGLRGYRYDARFIPLFANGPDAVRRTRSVMLSIEIGSSTARAASPDEIGFLEIEREAARKPPHVVSQQGRKAEVRPNGEAILARSDLFAEDDRGRATRCDAEACSGAGPIWWSGDGRRLRFMRRSGWGDSEQAIYEWIPGKNDPVPLHRTSDLLLDCQPLGERLLCVREQSATPRQVILIEPGSGDVEVLYDPNPGFADFALGKVERLQWRNAFGVETFGDLVFPVGYDPGQRYPLIIVQYISRGFLRGGVGDEFPIQVFSNRGYAVLSIQRPSSRQLVRDATSGADLQRRLLHDFRDRRSVLSSIEMAVDQLVQRGIADPDRIGLTGLSDGSSTVQFAAINSRRFKAASVSGCCWDPHQDAMVGPGAAKAFESIGWPSLLDEGAAFWTRMSLIRNARHIDLPLLMQQSDDEFRVAVPSYTALRQAGKPAALYVFPGEHHVKWQPAHRLAAYERNLRWFDYWLKGVVPTDELGQGEVEEWRAMR